MNLGEGSNPQELQLVALHRELTFQVTLLLLFALVVLQHRYLPSGYHTSYHQEGIIGVDS
jgi:hypothetical protein